MRRAQYDMPVGPEVWARWQHELEDALGAAPPAMPGTGRLSWPLLVWVPGDDWDPVERWVVYDMLPGQVLVEGAERRRTRGVPDDENEDLFWLAQLNGPHPRQRGRWDGVLKQFIPDPNCLIDRYQWELWRRYKAQAFAFWVIQGETGGHLIHYSNQERQVARLDGLPPEPAAPGALPYAPWDNRARTRLQQLNAIRQIRLEYALNGKTWSASQSAAYRDLLVAGTRAMLTGIDDYWHDAIRGVRIDYGDLPRVEGPDAVQQNEHITERILTNL